MKKSDTLLFCDRANGKPIGTFLTPIIIRVGVIETSVDVDVVRIFRHCKNDHRLGRNSYFMKQIIYNLIDNLSESPIGTRFT